MRKMAKNNSFRTKQNPGKIFASGNSPNMYFSKNPDYRKKPDSGIWDMKFAQKFLQKCLLKPDKAHE